MFERLKDKFFDPKKPLLKALGEVELPCFPAVVTEALDLFRDPDASLREIGDLVNTDPGLSVRILKAANSALYSLRHPARTVQHAVELLGRGEVESLLLVVAVADALPRKCSPSFDHAQFWEAAAARAATARVLARELHPATQAESFTAGLLQDMAVPLISQHRAVDYDPVLLEWLGEGGELAALERARFGWDHAELGKLLGQLWGLPDAVCDAIGSHHDGNESSAHSLPAVTIVSHIAQTDRDVGIESMLSDLQEGYGLAPDRTRELVDEGAGAAEAIAAQFTA